MMTNRMVSVLHLVLLLGSPALADAARVAYHAMDVEGATDESVADLDGESNATVGVAVAGQVLRDRYVLKEFVESRQSQYPYRYDPHRQPQHHASSGPGGIPGQEFPRITRRELSNPVHLGTGSFGDVWDAYDAKTQKHVAIKIFYSKSGGRQRFLTWKNANYQEQQEFDGAQKECSLVQNILSHRGEYPVGASRICECFGEHISDARGTDKALFLVMEMCGKSLGSYFIEPLKSRGAVDVDGARGLTKQMLEALDFMSVFNPPLIHHDLKPDNVAVTDKGEVKIIDWGGLVFGSPSNMYKPAVGTPLYTPPEADNGRCAFQIPASSYDVYAVGLMYMEMLCPSMDYNEWFYYRPLSTSTVQQLMQRKCRTLSSTQIAADLTLMGSMINRNPGARPSPSKALETAPLKPDERSPTSEPPNNHEAPSGFKVGDQVEYRSSTGEWLSGVIRRVNTMSNTYDIAYPDGTHMRDFADPARIRKLQSDGGRAAVDEAYQVPVHQNGIAGGGEKGYLLGNNVMQPQQPGNVVHVANDAIAESDDLKLFPPSVHVSYGTVYVSTIVFGTYASGVQWKFERCILKCGDTEADLTMKARSTTSTGCSGSMSVASLNTCTVYGIATQQSGSAATRVRSPPLSFRF